ncbi:MAG: hypothetical protein P8X75_10145 [Limibacillus sp.]|jgi:hypothetical protein
MYALVELQRLPEGNALIVAGLFRDEATANGPRRVHLGRICSKVVCLLTGEPLYDYGDQDLWLPEWSRLLQRMGASASDAERISQEVVSGVIAKIDEIRAGTSSLQTDAA